jgi:hypothetical protein
MSWKKTAPSVYVVAWRAPRIVKIGYTGTKRWRTFEGRGAEVLSLWTFDTQTEAFIIEAEAQECLRAVAAPAFDGPGPAAEYLGPGGGGWMECFRIDADGATTMLRKHANACARAYAPA